MISVCHCGHDRLLHRGPADICLAVIIVATGSAQRCSCSAYQRDPTEAPAQ